MASRRVLRGLVPIAIGSGLLLAGVTPTVAQESCSDITIEFNVRLVDPAPKAGAVIAVDIPAGTYDIVLVSSDPGHPGAPDQPDETWALVLDGYTSPSAPDLPTELVSQSATVASGVELAGSSTAQAIHTGGSVTAGSVEATSALLVCQSVLTTTTTTAAPTTTTTAEPTTTTAAPTTTQPTPTTEEEVLATTLVPPTTSPPTTAPTGTGTEELARTGASMSLTLTLLGGALIAAGTALVAGAYRRT